MRTACMAAFFLLLAAISMRAEPPGYAQREKPADSFSWLGEIEKNVPPLKHVRGDRLPMILWEAGPLEVQSPEIYKMLLARGLTQHIHMDEKMIPIAKALREAGSPVIMMEGQGGRWPSSLAGPPEAWQHDFEPGYVPKSAVLACPLLTKGWQVEAGAIRATLQKFKDEGVTVDAVWMDWEGDPAGAEGRYDQALHCKRCRALLPAGTLDDEQSFTNWCWRRYMELTGAYLAAPVAEIFPGCSTTNWHSTVSTPARPVLNWLDRPYTPVVPPFFTASNPVAYGNTITWNLWRAPQPPVREQVDQFYTNLLLREVSADAANRAVWAPGRKSVPWVCRWCPDDPNPAIPVMSRERYREVLRHLWLRGISAMQIFNPKREGFESMAVAEVQDAVAVYDEMLEYQDLLDHGTPLCLDVPPRQSDAVVWSGVRFGNQAVVRAFKQGGGKGSIIIEPWPGAKITLNVPPDGKTWLLMLKDKKAVIVK